MLAFLIVLMGLMVVAAMNPEKFMEEVIKSFYKATSDIGYIIGMLDPRKPVDKSLRNKK